MPLVASNIQSGWFWATLTTSFNMSMWDSLTLNLSRLSFSPLTESVHVHLKHLKHYLYNNVFKVQNNCPSRHDKHILNTWHFTIRNVTIRFTSEIQHGMVRYSFQFSRSSPMEYSTYRHQASCHSNIFKKLKTFLFSKHLCWFYCILSSPFYYTLHIYL